MMKREGGQASSSDKEGKGKAEKAQGHTSGASLLERGGRKGETALNLPKRGKENLAFFSRREKT